MDTEIQSLAQGEVGQDAPPAPRAQRGDGRDGAADPRLDKRTYLDKEHRRWSIKAHDYGDGLCEIGWSLVGSILVAQSGAGENQKTGTFMKCGRSVAHARTFGDWCCQPMPIIC